MGYHFRTFQSNKSRSKVEKVHERMKRLKEIREEMHISIQLAARLVKEVKTVKGTRFEEGILVWLEGKNINTTHPSAKLALK